MTTLNVGAGQAYATLAAAVAASRDGNVIAVQAGTYVNDFATISTNITIKGVGGMANFVATVAPPNGKGILVTQSDVTIQNLSFSGAAVADGNGAGIRYDSGNLVIIDSYFHDNQDGLLANADADGTIRIVGSEFANNGTGDGYTHNLYVGNIASLVIDDSYFHDAVIGHQIKSRAQSTTITNSRIYDGTAGTGSYSIDLPNGGVGIIRDNVIQQGANSDNPAIIHYGGESAAYAGSSLTIADNVVVNDMTTSPSVRLLSNATTVTAGISGNDVYGLTSSQIASGLASISGTIFLSARPSLDTTAPWLDGDSTIFGTSGPDTLAGTTGADTMVGLAGNDIYIVNNVGNVVQESVGQGSDNVYASVNYTLGAGQEVEYLRVYGSAGRTLTGNELANYLVGGTGNDTFNGGAGNDFLDGRAGADTMSGGAGNDIYVVDNAGDRVIEAVGGGSDNVYASVNYTLGAGQEVEYLRVYGSAGLTLTGNELANYLRGGTGNDTFNGGAGNDTLDGRAGADTMSGGAGNDIYVVDNAGDRVIEAVGGGSDNVYASVNYTLGAGQEVEYLRVYGSAGLTLTGNELANYLVGGTGNDTFNGGAGNDTFNGGAGNDRFTGGGAADTFVFGAGSGKDTIIDFAPGSDRINVSAYHFANFTSLMAATTNVGLNALINLDPNNSISLTGVLMSQLHAGDFVL